METSEDSRFDAIRPYRDEEVVPAVERLLSAPGAVDSIIDFQFKKSVLSSALLRPLTRWAVKNKFRKLKSVHDVQLCVAKFLDSMISSTTDGVTWDGYQNLNPDTGYLFISNHRDITLDPALINLGLHRQGRKLVRIAIGDNLLRGEVATDLMKLNQSFIVNRSAKGREMLTELGTLSDYMRLTISENKSIWIAEREGRAKDGNDLADPAIFKMMHMAGRKLKIPFAEYMSSLKIVPVAISYEYDPGDMHKAKELVSIARDGTYKKGEKEDIDSIVRGITGYKGRIHIQIGKPILDGFETPEELASLIDSFVHKNYRLFPTNLAAAGRTENLTAAEQKKFADRIDQMPEELRQTAIDAYAYPVRNAEAALEKK